MSNIVSCPSCGQVFATPGSMARHHSQNHPGNPEERFWALVDEGDDDECWPWMGCVHNGYGYVSLDCEEVYAHRYAYELETGSEPVGMLKHTCGNNTCCNPDHLYRAGIDNETR